MGNFKDEEKINDLRERLYSRGPVPKKPDAYELPNEPKTAPTSWQRPPEPKPTPQPAAMAAPEPVEIVTPEIAMATKKRSKKYRIIVLLAGLGFFILAMLLSSLFFFLGENNISGANINITINGPFTLGGGEAIPLQIGVTNQNTVPIETATLIVTYPPSTQSATEEGKSLSVERLPLDTVNPGETLNIPLRAIIFGEENEEKLIEAKVEYRIQGSNSIFEAKAEPLRFKINSSPVSLRVDALKKISSGQETEVTITIVSNSPTPLRDILVRAEYPTGFDFSRSTPAPVSGRNIWKLDELAPASERTIKITGIVIGEETDEYAIHYAVGVANANNPNNLASVFTTASTNFEIERPFIGVALSLNKDASGSAAVAAGATVDVSITVTNTLRDTIYDGLVVLTLSGNALSAYEVDANNGFYDSLRNQVRWEASAVQGLRQMSPGAKVDLSMKLKPDPNTNATPQLAFDVDVRARRIAEGGVSEELIGTAAGVARVTSVAQLLSEVARGTSVFPETGPVPPVANTPTTYTLTFLAENGTNDIGDVEVMAALPSYVTWLNQTSGSGRITFDQTSRTVTWNAGEISANQSKIASFQVSILPSVAQIGTTPTLLGEQRLRATDRFTNQVVRATRQGLTTQLSTESGFGNRNGTVRASEAEAF